MYLCIFITCKILKNRSTANAKECIILKLHNKSAHTSPVSISFCHFILFIFNANVNVNIIGCCRFPFTSAIIHVQRISMEWWPDDFLFLKYAKCVARVCVRKLAGGQKLIAYFMEEMLLNTCSFCVSMLKGQHSTSHSIHEWPTTLDAFFFSTSTL